MGSDFGIAVQVTIEGMILVFLTLIICALVISALNRFFKPKPEEEEEEEQPTVHILPVGTAAGAGAGEGDEAAAVAVAIALVRRAATSPQRLGAGAGLRMAPAMSRAPQGSPGDEIIVGEVVTVTSIDPGPATWSGYGRVKVAQ